MTPEHIVFPTETLKGTVLKITRQKDGKNYDFK